MATTTNKQRLVNHLFTTLGKGAKALEQANRPLLEEFLYAILREGSTAESADQAFLALKKNFFDWNEIRVSTSQEIADVIDPFVEQPHLRSQRIIDFLQEVFETTFSFDLDSLEKKGLKQAAKTLGRYQAASDYAVAWVTQHSLGGHAIPVDSPSLRVLRRLGLIEEDQDSVEAMRATLEHQIPKAKGLIFINSISVLARDHCWEEDPACPGCPMKTQCLTGNERKTVTSATKKPR